jgi:hypothetical protein
MIVFNKYYKYFMRNCNPNIYNTFIISFIVYIGASQCTPQGIINNTFLSIQNCNGYYLMQLGIGTPTQLFNMFIDTGS